MNWDLLNNKNSRVIKLGARIVNALSVVSTILHIFNAILQLISKTAYFQAYVYAKFFFVVM